MQNLYVFYFNYVPFNELLGMFNSRKNIFLFATYLLGRYNKFVLNHSNLLFCMPFFLANSCLCVFL